LAGQLSERWNGVRLKPADSGAAHVVERGILLASVQRGSVSVHIPDLSCAMSGCDNACGAGVSKEVENAAARSIRGHPSSSRPTNQGEWWNGMGVPRRDLELHAQLASNAVCRETRLVPPLQIDGCREVIPAGQQTGSQGF